MNLVIKCDKAVESGNRFVRAPWYIYSGYRNAWHKMLGIIVGRPPLEWKPQARTAMTIISYRVRAIDHDNLVSGTKPIPDFLVRFGWLLDDDIGSIDPIIFQRRAKVASTTIILQQNGRSPEQEIRYKEIIEIQARSKASKNLSLFENNKRKR